jgi:hypothetical protein
MSLTCQIARGKKGLCREETSSAAGIIREYFCIISVVEGLGGEYQIKQCAYMQQTELINPVLFKVWGFVEMLNYLLF